MDGKRVRLSRIMAQRKDGKGSGAVIVPMDHGVSDGPITGLENIQKAVADVAAGGATGVVLHKGMARVMDAPPGRGPGLIIHLSASTSMSMEPNAKVLVGSVDEALLAGADAVSIHVNVGGEESEPAMLSDFGEISTACTHLGIPLLVMIYPRGPKVSDPFNADTVAHAARIGAELGADMVKTVFTGKVESFKRVIQSCPVPVVIAGGPLMKRPGDMLAAVEMAMTAGAAGVSLGRNIFSSKYPVKMTAAIRAIIIDGKSSKDALKMLD